MGEMLRRRGAVGLTVGAMVGIAVAAALPWAHSGRATRSAFALARTADELGVVRGPLARALFIALAFVPAAAGATWVAAVQGWDRVVAGLGVLGGLLTITGVVVVWRVQVDRGVGVTVAVVAALLALAGALVITLTERNR
jgi:hypothetical protein